MRIAILTNTTASHSGAGRIAHMYAHLLESRGHVVRFWTARREFEQLAQMSSVSRLVFHLNDLAVREETVKEILAWKPDALFSHNLTGCGFGTPASIRAHGIRWVHVLHDVQLIEPSGQIRVGAIHESLARIFIKSLWRKTWSACRHAAMGEPDAVVSPTAWLLKFHQHYGWFRTIKTAVIPNPVRPHPQPFSFTKRGKAFLFVGRVDKDKGIFVLLDAWKQLAMPDARLIVIGDGSSLDALRLQSIPRIEFRGIQSSEDVRRAMEESVVVVVPSIILENQPTVILEALAAGCDIIASDVGGIAETLDGIGTLVPPRDSQAFAQAMLKTADDARDSMNDARRKTILARHDPEVCVERLLELLSSNL